MLDWFVRMPDTLTETADIPEALRFRGVRVNFVVTDG
jgi:hypothetical protein